MNTSNRHYNAMVEQGASAPCNGCNYEKVCKDGFTCEQYRKWEYMRQNEWAKNLSKFSKVPDMAI
jgi:hypothetical protein